MGLHYEKKPSDADILERICHVAVLAVVAACSASKHAAHTSLVARS